VDDSTSIGSSSNSGASYRTTFLRRGGIIRPKSHIQAGPPLRFGNVRLLNLKLATKSQI
jgi:hypothetical protein